MKGSEGQRAIMQPWRTNCATTWRLPTPRSRGHPRHPYVLGTVCIARASPVPDVPFGRVLPPQFGGEQIVRSLYLYLRCPMPCPSMATHIHMQKSTSQHAPLEYSLTTTVSPHADIH